MKSDKIAAFLRSIPQSNQDAAPIDSIAPQKDIDVLYGYALMLQTIGIVEIDEARNIKATSQTAKYTLSSIASYVENGIQWVDDWKTRGVNRKNQGVLQNGATLLHELEKRRLNVLDNPTPSREEEVVQVIIKRTNPETGKAEFLMQYDKNADQYQLIGGRRSPNDDTLQIAIIREIEEEVRNDLNFPDDYELSVVVPDMVIKSILSPTFGALTEYHFRVYHMTQLNQTIELQENDAWVSLEDVLSGVVSLNGRVIIAKNKNLYQEMDRLIDGGLASLTNSFRI